MLQVDDNISFLLQRRSNGCISAPSNDEFGSRNMAVSALLASLLAAHSASAVTVDVAYDELVAGKAAAAIDRIEHSEARAQNNVAA